MAIKNKLSAPRFAVYYAPPAFSQLWRLGSRWLGYDAIAGDELKLPRIADGERGDLDAERWQRWTVKPRRYGFHATLKPPFHLREGVTVDELAERVQTLSESCFPVEVGPMEIATISRCVALRPIFQSPALAALASRFVREVDDLRAPLTGEELARRKRQPLTLNQRELLERWGYPFVMDEFRFHLTLTDAIPDPQRHQAGRFAKAWFRPILPISIVVGSVSLFVESRSGESLRLIERFDFSDPIDLAGIS